MFYNFISKLENFGHKISMISLEIKSKNTKKVFNDQMLKQILIIQSRLIKKISKQFQIIFHNFKNVDNKKFFSKLFSFSVNKNLQET